MTRTRNFDRKDFESDFDDIIVCSDDEKELLGSDDCPLDEALSDLTESKFANAKDKIEDIEAELKKLMESQEPPTEQSQEPPTKPSKEPSADDSPEARRSSDLTESKFVNANDVKKESEFCQRMINYDVMMMRSNNSKPLEISFDDVDKYNFSKRGFIEYIISQKYVHLYFDFDGILTNEEKINKTEINDETKVERVAEIFTWLDSLKPIFGEYSVG